MKKINKGVCNLLGNVLLTVFSLAFILLFCFLFTNAVEWFGKKLNLGQGVVGSVLAAVGTALPETIIPIIAILYYHNENAKEIGIGAIAGAPFMLGTLAFFVTGLAVIVYAAMGKRSYKMSADVKVISRDITFFLVIYGIAVLTSFIHNFTTLKCIIAVALLLSYLLYLKQTLNDDCEQCEDLEPLYFTKLFKVKTNLTWIIIQLVIALGGIIYGAHLFVNYVEALSTVLGIAPLILSIIITPIATELPEKLNSVIWSGKGKDTLALGNITGAMVFQSCFPVVFGMIFTPWDLTGITLVSAIIAIVSGLINLVWLKFRKTVNPYMLLSGGILYAIFLFYAF